MNSLSVAWWAIPLGMGALGYLLGMAFGPHYWRWRNRG